MKKIKRTFWLLGFGCGITFAGTIGTWVTLQIDTGIEQSSQEQSKQNEKMEEFEAQNQTDLKNTSQKENLQDSEQAKEYRQEKDVNNNQVVVDNKKELTGGEENKTIKEHEEKIEEYCEVFIPSTSGASDICSILESAGVIESGKEFRRYIKEQGKQTYLKDGTFSLPKGADYETLLALLLS